jgi:hypothetical protein
MGIACVGVDGSKVDVIANSIMTHPISSLVDNFRTHRGIFIDEIKRWLDAYSPDAIIMERFQTRGNMGPLIELVSTMNAVVTMIEPDLPCKLITAATWKNAHNRRFTEQLDDMYPICLTAPHQLDATLIGVFGLEAGLRETLSYTPKNIIKQVQATSALPLRRPR